MSQLKRKREMIDAGAAKANIDLELPHLATLPAGSAACRCTASSRGPRNSSAKLHLVTTLICVCDSQFECVCQVTLPGEGRSTVLLVLEHLYQPTLGITSIADAEIMSAFAHKYELPGLMKQCGAYLINNIKAVLATKSAFGWAHFAEWMQMWELLAHCERHITLYYASFLHQTVVLVSECILLPGRSLAVVACVTELRNKHCLSGLERLACADSIGNTDCSVQ